MATRKRTAATAKTAAAKPPNAHTIVAAHLKEANAALRTAGLGRLRIREVLMATAEESCDPPCERITKKKNGVEITECKCPN